MTQAERLVQITKSNEQVIAILAYGRSGSIFLQSLFDEHPNVIVTAGIYLQYLYGFLEENKGASNPELIEQFMTRFAILFEPNAHFDIAGRLDGIRLDELGEHRNMAIRVNQNVFRDTLSCLCLIFPERVSRKYFVQAIHVAYQLALGRPLVENMRIVYPLHDSSLVATTIQFMEDFPQAKYLFTVREPLPGFDSYFHRNQIMGDGARNAMNALTHMVIGARWVPGRPLENSRAIKVEELNAHPEPVLRRMCSWLGLEWDACLLRSTFHGLLWWGDAASEPRNGFFVRPVGAAPMKEFSPFDCLRFRVLLFHKYATWGYPISGFYRSTLARMLILPLLLVPFRSELRGWAAFRLICLESLRQQKDGRNILWFFKKMYWVTGLGATKIYVQHRKFFFRVWWQTFNPPPVPQVLP